MLSILQTNLIGIYTAKQQMPNRSEVIDDMKLSYLYTEDNETKALLRDTIHRLSEITDDEFIELAEKIEMVTE